MSTQSPEGLGRIFLGIECGGTRTTAMAEAFDTGKRTVWEGGPANLRLMTDAQLLRHFGLIRKAFPPPLSIAVGMAGVRTPGDIARIQQTAAKVWPNIPCFASHDLETALAAAPTVPTRGSRKGLTQVLVLSGTGSCCLGRTATGRTVKIGGWGHILGDKGSAYEIGLRALKAVVYYLDRDREWSGLGKRILRRLLLNEPNDLIDWVKTATKDQVAALAMEVFPAAVERDRIAQDILAGAAASLARDAVACARRLTKPSERVQFVFAGSVLVKQPEFSRQVTRRIRAEWRRAVVTPLEQPGVVGAVEIAKRSLKSRAPIQQAARSAREEQWKGLPKLDWTAVIPESTGISPTEQRNPLSRHLDRLSLAKGIELFLSEDAAVPGRILPHRRHLEKAIALIVAAFRKGGRLIYVGAGTSGRLGVLDASECPPTFRTPPELVQGVIAGGVQALWQSIEGAEDDPEQGAQAMTFRGVTAKDVVIGIAASGRTPFVWGALAAARRLGAATVLLCFNPHLRFQRGQEPDVVLAIDVGPELLTGSTRLKSGTATKLILNLLTTLSLVKMGKVASNLMIDLNPSNVKLRGRAIRILKELTGAEDTAIQTALEKTGWRVKEAWGELARLKVGPPRKKR